VSGCQQFSHIVNKNPERYRGVSVSHEGRKELRVKTNDLFSKQADWNGLINGFTAEIGRFWAVVPCRPSAPLHPSHCAALVGPSRSRGHGRPRVCNGTTAQKPPRATKSHQEPPRATKSHQRSSAAIVGPRIAGKSLSLHSS